MKPEKHSGSLVFNLLLLQKENCLFCSKHLLRHFVTKAFFCPFLTQHFRDSHKSKNAVLRGGRELGP